MTRMANSQLMNRRRYIAGVIDALQESQGISHDQARDLFRKYGRPVIQNWGFEPNVEEFADKILNIDSIVSKARNNDGSQPSIQWKKINKTEIKLSDVITLGRSSEAVHFLANKAAQKKLKHATLVRR